MSIFKPKRGSQDWMLTFSGVQYFPNAPRVEDVRIVDIAHHLSRVCRFNGAIRPEHYSVAEHSVHVSYCVRPDMAFMGLMHDAPEAYVSDVVRPAKRALPDYRTMERKNWLVIAEKFGLPNDLPSNIHLADIAVYLKELEVLMPRLPADQGIWGTPASIEILALGPNAAKIAFLNRYYELTRGHAVPVLQSIIPTKKAVFT